MYRADDMSPVRTLGGSTLGATIMTGYVYTDGNAIEWDSHRRLLHCSPDGLAPRTPAAANTACDGSTMPPQRSEKNIHVEVFTSWETICAAFVCQWRRI
ncbi:hypothetical protein JOB18_044033 [Solea senegalensis]|uniref:Uncharacterized protein n=1 Tax=Solea senegalensis TaxID=28829 RepID=A0AAV6QL37_SOLSE|nr:hypothetical protein JOB18_044033 [Solea senegalensis]